MQRRIWVLGECWRCDRYNLPVMWLGPVQSDHGHGPFYACEPCICRLEELIRVHSADR